MSGFRPRFFVSQAEPAHVGAELSLSPEDSHHASRVLRLGHGDECEVVVGAAVYAATVCVAADPVKVRLVARLEGQSAGALYHVQVGLVQALGKPAAMDYVLEKGTEVGASFFRFVTTGGPSKRPDAAHGDRLDRWCRIVREAAKQSKQVVVPDVAPPTSIDEAIHELDETGSLSIVLEPTAPEGLDQVLAGGTQAGACCSRVALWIGPEGGWTFAEAERFSVGQMATARLGRSVLRTETAGPVAVAVARLALGDW